jgi:2-polyprenyl-3-methyl-5-hydroxy-6-metoxy-1,4-benzoquinol methylase
MAVFREIFAEGVEACGDCGFVYTNPRMSAKNLEKYYSRNYRLEGLAVPKSLEEFLGDSYKEIWFSKERDFNLVLAEKSGGRLLDVGCASGSLLWLAKQKGFAVKGVEVGRASADFATNVLGIEVFCGQLEDARFRDREFDVITMIHSLEHVPDPRRVFKEIHRILADDGALVVVVPNFGSWSAKQDGARWKWLQPENHYSHFTPEILVEMANRESFIAAMATEEGRYGEEDIRAAYGAEDIQKVQAELRGSEIIFVGRKRFENTEAAATQPASVRTSLSPGIHANSGTGARA